MHSGQIQKIHLIKAKEIRSKFVQPELSQEELDDALFSHAIEGTPYEHLFDGKSQSENITIT